MRIVSVDLGMGPDPTSVAVMERRTWESVGNRVVERADSTSLEPIYRSPDGKEVDRCPPAEYHLRHIERMPPGTSYSEIVQRVKTIRSGVGSSTLAIDATGVGQAAVDLFERAGMGPYVVTITAGGEVTETGWNIRVPKKDVISAAQVLLQTERLRIARDLPSAQLLLRELQNFRMNVDLKKNSDALAWREGANDDLVLALAVGLWIGERHPGFVGSVSSERRDFFLGYF